MVIHAHIKFQRDIQCSVCRITALCLTETTEIRVCFLSQLAAETELYMKRHPPNFPIGWASYAQNIFKCPNCKDKKRG